MKIVPVIMAGGAGTRLWPLSREEKPKQFHNLTGKRTLLGETINRLKPIHPEHYLVVTSNRYEDLSVNELELNGVTGTVLSEPAPKNTAAAVLYAAVFLDKFLNDSIMIVLPADHHIVDNNRFSETIMLGIDESKNDKLVTIGIKPEYPETGYGYIKAVDNSTGDILPIDKFVEKPDFETAKEYVNSGNYFWNSGIFIWKTSQILKIFNKHMPNHTSAFKPLQNLTYDKIKSNDSEIWKMKKDIFNGLESISIDNGIMEKAENCSVIPADFGWADLGSWKAIDDVLTPDENSNRTPHSTRAIFVNSKNCSVYSEKKRISVVGMEDVVVVEAGDEILVINKESSQDMRKVVDIIKGN